MCRGQEELGRLCHSLLLRQQGGILSPRLEMLLEPLPCCWFADLFPLLYHKLVKRLVGDDLRRPGGSGSTETTAFSKEGSSGQDGWAALSSMMRSTGKAGAGGVTQRGMLDRCWAEAEIASGMSGSEGGEVWYQDRLRHSSRVHDTGKEHVRDQPGLP